MIYSVMTQEYIYSTNNFAYADLATSHYIPSAYKEAES